MSNSKFVKLLLSIVLFLSASITYASSHDNQFTDKCYIEYKKINISNGKEEDYGYAIAKDGDRYMTWSREVLSRVMIFQSAKRLYPTACYEDDTVYYFMANERVLYANVDYLATQNYVSIINWKKPIESLAIPEVLIPLMGSNRFNNDRKNVTEPVFEKSIKEQFKGENYDVDVYSSVVSNSAGRPMFTRHYYYYFSKDKLSYAKMTLSVGEGKESVKGIISVKEISKEIPEVFYKWKKSYKLSNADGEAIDILLDENHRY